MRYPDSRSWLLLGHPVFPVPRSPSWIRLSPADEVSGSHNYWTHRAAYGIKLFARPKLSPVFRGVRIPLAEYLKSRITGLFVSAPRLKDLRQIPYRGGAQTASCKAS